jgi:small subunit ribosomal protein S5e
VLGVEDDRPEFAVEPKMFGKWSYEGVQSPDNSLSNYLQVKPTRQQVFVPYTAGRYQQRRFKKASCPIVERLTCMIMVSGHRNNGKKQLAVRITKQTLELIHLLTGENPIQVLVTAIAAGGCREDSTRIGSGGVVRRQAVDVSPLRRVNQAIYLICKGARESAFRSLKSISETLADEIINASKVSVAARMRFHNLTLMSRLLRAPVATPTPSARRTKSRESPRATDERIAAVGSTSLPAEEEPKANKDALLHVIL